jgi:hypothetical protein
MELNLIFEPDYAETLWGKQYLEGIRTEAERCGDRLCLREPDYFAEPVLTAPETHRPLTLLIGTSVSWIPHTASFLNGQGVHCILLAYSASMVVGSVSSVTMDYKQAVRSLTQYLEQNGRSRIALLGINPDSSNDMQKYDAFLHYRRRRGVLNPEKDVFWNFAQLHNMCQLFYNAREQYDAVICANDVAAILVLNFLQNNQIKVPEGLYIASIGDTKLARMIKPGITAAKLDFFEAGRQAVQLYTILDKNPDLTALTATVNCRIHADESTDFAPVRPYVEPEADADEIKPVWFYSDQEVIDILHLEDLLNRCDDIDLNILHGISAQQKYIDLAETLHISENTVKYRLRKMLGLTGQNTREDLIGLVQRYFGW